MDDRSPVLVVDDDPDIRDTLREVIEAEGLAVVCASDGLGALEALRRGLRPSLVVLDLMMPVMSGWELLEHLQESDRTARIPVVVVSAMAAPGVSEHLAKPIALDVLLATVQRWTQH